MLAQIRNLSCVRATLALIAAFTLASCATRAETQLVSDPAAQRESSMPWNQQEKWEGQGQFGPVAEQLNGRTR
jgi:outer membrane biogenesis lipoprotein LolB